MRDRNHGAYSSWTVAVLLATLVVSTGCTTTMTNMTSARTLEPGEFEGNVNGQINLNSSPVRTGIEAGQEIENEIRQTPAGEDVSEKTVRQALDFVLATALFRPNPTPEAAFRAGLAEFPFGGLDAGIRYNGSTVKGDVKLQYWSSSDDNWAASIQGGFGYQASIGSSALQYVTLTDWSRYDVDILAPIGYKFREIARAWVAPRFVYSHISTSPKLDSYFRKRLPPSVKNARAALFSGNENLYYAGLNLGGMIGYKYAFLALEVTASRVFFTPEILGRERDLSGFSVVPAVGLVVNF